MAAHCDGPTMTLLESAVIQNTMHAVNGDNLTHRVVSKEITEIAMNG